MVSYCLSTSVIFSLYFLLLARGLPVGHCLIFSFFAWQFCHAVSPQPTMWSHQAEADAKSEADRSA